MESVVQLRSVAAELSRQRHSRDLRTNVANALYGAADYLVQPFGMLLAAPFLLHRLGTSQYGLWMLAIAVISGAGMVSIGLGDAALRYVALCRGRTDRVQVARVIRTALTLNLLLGGITALLVAAASRPIINHVFIVEAQLRSEAIVVLRLGALVLWVRAIEIVLINTMRAYERYGLAVKVSSSARAATIVAAVASAALGYGVIGIVAATLAISSASVVALAVCANTTAGPISFAPLLSKTIVSEMFGFSGILWLQALAGITFSHADRLMIGSMLGTAALAQYTICVQGAQPIHGLIAAALHFLFPHLSARLAISTIRVRNGLLPVVLTNVALAMLLCLPLVCFSKPLLSLWMGTRFAAPTWAVYAIASLGFGFLSLNVTAHYALLALGDVRYVSGINALAAAITLFTIWLLIPRYGILGAALGRLIYGPITWVMYYRLYALLSTREETHSGPIVMRSMSEEFE